MHNIDSVGASNPNHGSPAHLADEILRHPASLALDKHTAAHIEQIASSEAADVTALQWALLNAVNEMLVRAEKRAP